MKKLISWSNAVNVVVAVFIIVVIVNPQAKAFILQGLMKIGLFKAPTQNNAPGTTPANTSITLSFVDAQGKIINTADHKGKVIFINLWATWCPPCIAEMPSIVQMYRRYSRNNKVLIITVDVDNDFDKSQAFLNKNGYRLPVYHLTGNIPDYLFSGSIPTTIIADKTGAIVAKHEGAADYTDDRFYSYLDGLIAR